MSARYSNSPALRLTIAESRQLSRPALLALPGWRPAACIGCRCAATRLLALVLLLASHRSPAGDWPAQRLPGAASAGSGASGAWSERSSSRGISLSRASTCLPWVIYLAWTEAASARRGSAIRLFADSAPGGTATAPACPAQPGALSSGGVSTVSLRLGSKPG